ITLVMTLAGAFFSNRARTSAHIDFVPLTGVLGDFIKDLERAGCKSGTHGRRYRRNGYAPYISPKPRAQKYQRVVSILMPR
ncbi:hypothetical protein, partial [Pseudomonas proteolytica]|uniref:hypothetical protein n=1 Tax=Pseudomonas proteolytica TaxID=219574 RepID=UPI0030DB7CED